METDLRNTVHTHTHTITHTITMEGLKTKFSKFKRYLSGSPVEGETYEETRVSDLPHMKDADGALVAVSSGKRELSPVLSAKYNIQPGKSGSAAEPANQIDDTIN